MPTYEYRCSGCGHGFEIVQSMKDKTKRKCPQCGKNRLERVLGTPLVFTKGEPQTIKHLAERNTERMGKYELGDKIGEVEEANKKAVGNKSVGASKKEIRKMTPEQKKRYIEKGTK